MKEGGGGLFVCHIYIYIYIYIFVYFHYFLPLLLINGPLKISYKELYINLLKGYRCICV